MNWHYLCRRAFLQDWRLAAQPEKSTLAPPALILRRPYVARERPGGVRVNDTGSTISMECFGISISFPATWSCVAGS